MLCPSALLAAVEVNGHQRLACAAPLLGMYKNFKHAEAGWTLENNTLINEAIIAIKGDPYKKYRIYEKAI